MHKSTTNTEWLIEYQYVFLFQEFRSFWPEKGRPISIDAGNFKLTYREDEERKKYVIRDFLLESTQVRSFLVCMDSPVCFSAILYACL